jgi:hypothetical protein
MWQGRAWRGEPLGMLWRAFYAICWVLPFGITFRVQSLC